MKLSNKARAAAAEVAEGRDPAKGNSPECNAFRTLGRGDAHSALERVRQAARRKRKQRFTALLHHVYDIERLRAVYLGIKRDAAAGVDGETWRHYGEDLEANLQDLAARLKRGAYRAKPVLRAYIQKTDGRQRPLGIPALEDKIVQRAVVDVLNAIYEQDFLGFSYGFRPGRSPHQALDALSVGIMTKKVNWVLDADIRSFFDTLKHEWLVKFRRAPCGRPAHRTAHPEMAGRRCVGGWEADTERGRHGPGRQHQSAAGQPVSALCIRLLDATDPQGGSRMR
jgi:RNA-directed DNA polymerase